MRDEQATDAEGFNLQQGLAGALPGAVQGAAAGTSIMPGWGTLIGALGGAAMGLAQQGGGPSRPAAPAPVRRPIVSAPIAPAAPVSAPGAQLGGSPLTQVLQLLQNPMIQQLLGTQPQVAQPQPAPLAPVASPAALAPAPAPTATMTSTPAPPAIAAPATPPAPPAVAPTESEAEATGALQWLVSQRVARLR